MCVWLSVCLTLFLPAATPVEDDLNPKTQALYFVKDPPWRSENIHEREAPRRCPDVRLS